MSVVVPAKMGIQLYKNPRLIIWAAVSLFVVDRLLKDLAVREAPLCASPVTFSLYLNRGLAFSLHVPPVIFWTLMAVGVAALVWAAMRHARHHGTWPLALIIVALGAASNLYDRLVGGAVVDYFLLFCYSAFNIADLMIVGGLLWAVLEEKQ
jgi:lipoprotein signal peptidase